MNLITFRNIFYRTFIKLYFYFPYFQLHSSNMYIDYAHYAVIFTVSFYCQFHANNKNNISTTVIKLHLEAVYLSVSVCLSLYLPLARSLSVCMSTCKSHQVPAAAHLRWYASVFIFIFPLPLFPLSSTFFCYAFTPSFLIHLATCYRPSSPSSSSVAIYPHNCLTSSLSPCSIFSLKYFPLLLL